MVIEQSVLTSGGGAVAPRPVRSRLPLLLGVAAVTVAALVGAGLAARLALGLAVLGALLLAPFVMGNLRLAVALWVPLLFLPAVPMANIAGKAAGLVIVSCWAAGRLASDVGREWPREHRRLVGKLALLLGWLVLSVLWAPGTGRALTGLSYWAIVAVIFVVITTTVDSLAAARMVATAFVAGAVVSMGIDLLPAGLDVVALPPDAETARLYGGAGDPNILAAGLLPAVILLAGLLKGTGLSAARWLGCTGIAVLAAGVAMSGSRGALVSAVLTVPLGLLLLKAHRGQIAVVALAAVVVAFAVVSVSPNIRERLTASDGGSGRSDLWRVAWRTFADHPVAGVGVNNFVEVSPGYVRDVGPLQYVDLIAEVPHQAHNAYLQFLAENGMVGMVLLALFIGGCLAASWQAARRLDAAGDERGAVLARCVLLASLAMLTAFFFLPSIVDTRIWVLLALGPALLGASGRRPGPDAVADERNQRDQPMRRQPVGSRRARSSSL